MLALLKLYSVYMSCSREEIESLHSELATLGIVGEYLTPRTPTSHLGLTLLHSLVRFPQGKSSASTRFASLFALPSFATAQAGIQLAFDRF